MDRDISMYLNHLSQKDVHEYLEAVGRQYDRLNDENKSLMERIASFNEADEIKKHADAVKDIRKRSLLVMTEKEVQSEIRFRDEHTHFRGTKMSLFHSTFQYEITGTGVGTILKIRCPQCGQEQDITDYDAW